MAYVDGYVIPLSESKLNEYRKLAEIACEVWIDHGALDYKECLIDDDNIEGMRSFADSAAAKKGETVIFAYIVYQSREHRDEVNKKAMEDPRLKGHCENPPFDCKRMAYGGFEVLVEPRG